jgi:NADH-quinone oxidoreductase subunit F
LERPLTKNIDLNRPLNLKEYEQTGGYAAVRKVLQGMAPGEVQKLVQASNLKGRGGGGFNTGLKWSFRSNGRKYSPTQVYHCQC